MNLHEALWKSAARLQRQMEEHTRILALARDGHGGGERKGRLPGASRETDRFKQTLVETIEVLESTRKSFKSRQIEQLRKKLVRTLAELS